MTAEEKEKVLDEYKSSQRLQVKDRIAKAAEEEAARFEEAKTNPLVKEALKMSLIRQKEFHRKQLESIDAKLAKLV